MRYSGWRRPLLSLVLLLASLWPASRAAAGERPGKVPRQVAMVVFKGESAADRGFREGIRAGKDGAISLTVFDAKGSLDRAKEILRRLSTSGFDLVYTSGSAVSNVALDTIKDRPVVFAALRRPGDRAPAGRNSTGAYGEISWESIFSTVDGLIKSRKVALITGHERGAPGSRDQLLAAQKRYGFKVIPIPIGEDEPASGVLTRVVDAKADAVILPPELAGAVGESIVQAAKERGIAPVVVTGEGSPKAGALLSLAPDYREVGARAAGNALEVLRGRSPDRVPAQTVRTLKVEFDLKTADRLGINLPLQLMALSAPGAGTPAHPPSSSAARVSSEEIRIILQTLLSLVLIVAVGVLIGQWDEWMHQQALIKLIDYIFLPCLVFSALHRHPFDLNAFLQIATAVAAMVGLLAAVSLHLPSDEKDSREKLVAAVAMTSATVLLPLSFMLFGHEGLAKGVYFHLLVLFFYHAFGSLTGTSTLNLRQFFKVPALYMAALGLAAAGAPQPGPGSWQEFLWLSEKGIEMTGAGALPLLLLSFGYPLGQLRFSTARLGVPGGAVRIVLSPLLGLLLVFLFRKIGWFYSDPGSGILSHLGLRITESVLILGAAMPSSHFALRLGVPGRYPAGDRESGTVLVTAIGAVFTVGVVLFLISALVLR